jgi:DNA-binding transcriptional regulator/RsmH inhibitor MraZ
MDRKLSKSQEIERLIRIGDAARYQLGSDAVLLKQRLDVPSRLRSSLKSHPTGWLFGSLASGLAASLLFRRRPERERVEKKPRSFPLVVLGLTLTAVRPFAKVWLTDQVKNYLSGRFNTPYPLRQQTNPHHQQNPS